MLNSYLKELCGGRLSHLNDFDHKDPLWLQGKLLEVTFTELVDRLRNPQTFPNPRINGLMSIFWRLVGNHIVPSSVMPSIPTMSFWCEVKNGTDMMATIICPADWPQRLQKEPHMQMGAMVYNASKAQDYWNLRIPGLNEDQKDNHFRAMAWESELYRQFLKDDPGFTPNEYQQTVLEKFPNGLDSEDAKVLVYESRPFPEGRAAMLVAGPPWPIDVYNMGNDKEAKNDPAPAPTAGDGQHRHSS